LSSRVDAEAYRNGAYRLRNVRLKAQGGCTRRPGLKYLQTLANEDYQTEAYVYDEDEAYILFFSNTKLRIVDISNPTAILQTITSCPWLTAHIGSLVVAQSGDTMFITHPSIPMQKLQRTSATNFSRTEFAFDTSSGLGFQPYFKFATGSVTLTPSGTSGSVTLTASADAFTSAYNGMYLRLVDSANTVRHALISGYTSATVVTATLSGAIADTDAITEWQEPVFSSVRGYARAVTLHDQRLIFGGSRDLPNFLFMSKIAEFTNFDVGTGNDDESIQIQIAEAQVSEIKALQSFRFLTIFTSEQELYVPTSENKPLTPSTITVKKQTSYGSGSVQPQEFDGAIVFLTKSKGAIREFIFSDISQAYNSDSITLLSEHIIGTPSAIEAQRESVDQMEGYLYLLNTDGHMPVFMSIRKEKVQGWVRYDTTGSFKNMVNVNRQIYTVVERTINSSTVKSLELFQNDHFLDMSSQLSGSASSTWTVAHLPNTAVQVRSGNYSLGTYTTNGSGVVTLDQQVTSVEVGLAYTPEITTLPPEMQLPDGVSVGQKRRVVRAVLDLVSTLNVKAGGTRILLRSVTDDFSQEPTSLTQRKEVYLLGWSKEGRVTVTQEEPLPMTLNGILLEVEV
jgi:hypothetical protein